MTRTILLADDSVTIQKVVELTFLDEDFRVVAFGNGADAIERAAEVRPDVVLADVHMPGADGYEVCAAVRRSLPSVPVLLLVGTFEVFDAARAAEAGAAGHLKKPFDSQELMHRVKDLIAAGTAAAPPAPGYGELRAPEPALGAAPIAAAVAAAEDDSWSFEPVGEPEPAPMAAKPEASSWSAPLEAGHEDESAVAAPGAEAVGALSEADVDRIARRVVELAAERVVREVAWEVVPDLAEVLLKARIRELEASVE